MRIKLEDSAYSSKFRDIIYSWDRYIIAYGGRGSGKTDSFYIKYLLALFEPYYFKLAYINKEHSNIRDHQYAGFKRVAKRIGLYDKLKFYDGDYRIINLQNGNMLIPKGMDDPEKTKGLDEITAIWWDEINKGSVEDFRTLNELLRSPAAEYLQFAMSFNPVRLKHWLREVFFHPDDSHAAHPNFKSQALLNRSTYKDNEYINQEAYLQTLINGAAGNMNTIRVNVEGDWGLDENGNPWLFAFTPEKNVKPIIQYLPQFEVYLSFDFNRDPVTCIAFQQSPNKGGKYSFVHAIKEFALEQQISDLCARIKATFPGAMLFVTGDASGNSGNVGYTSRHASIYSMIQSYLQLSDKQMHLNTHNLQHNDSRNLLNTLFYSYPSLHIAQKVLINGVEQDGCPQLINDCTIATVDEDSATPGKLKKDRSVYKMDLFDAMRYFYQTYFLEYCNEVYWTVKK